MILRALLAAYLAVLLVASDSAGQVPYHITYEGELTEDDCLAEGIYSMEFSIWTLAVGGTKVFQSLAIDVPVSHGRFAVHLPVSPETFLSPMTYLETTVEGVPLSPRERITSSAYSLQTRGLWVDEDFNVGIKTNVPQASLDVKGDTRLGGDTTVVGRLGVGDPSLLFGQLSVVDSGEGVPFAISAEWNNDSFPTIFASNAGSGGVLYANGSSDAEPSGGGIIVAGDEAGHNVAIDANEIMARNGTEVSPLYLNNNGGEVIVGGTLDIGWELVSEVFENENGYAALLCPEGKRPLGGGCHSVVGLDPMEASAPTCHPDGRCGWECHMDNSNGAVVFVICANVK